eukprot:22854_1
MKNHSILILFISSLIKFNKTQHTFQKLLPNDGERLDYFGECVSIYDKYIVIGANSDDDKGDRAGAAYVFEGDAQTNQWTQTAKLTPNVGDYRLLFGSSVGIYDRYIVVGATYDSNPGKAYIFERDLKNNQWSQTTTLIPNNQPKSDCFGGEVSIYRQTVVVGDVCAPGAAYVFELDNQTNIWTQVATLSPDDRHPSDGYGFGRAVGIFNNYAVVGCPWDDSIYSQGGSAYIYERDPPNNEWNQVAKVMASDMVGNDWFGYTTAIYDKYIVIGAYYKDSSNKGATYVFQRDPDHPTWTQSAKIVPADGLSYDYFGYDVAVYGTHMISSAYYDDDFAINAGSAYMFDLDNQTDTWIQKDKFLPELGASEDHLGRAVSIYDKYVVVGTDYADDNGDRSGCAYVYMMTDPTQSPSSITINPTDSTTAPSAIPTINPTIPTINPTDSTAAPSTIPTMNPSTYPTPTDITYSTVDATQLTETTSSTTVSDSRFVYMGCWKDTEDDRALSHYFGSGFTIMSCFSECFSNDDRLFALQNGGECWCGDSINDATKHGSSTECTNQRLDGFLSFDLFKILTSTTDSSHSTISMTTKETINNEKSKNNENNIILTVMICVTCLFMCIFLALWLRGKKKSETDLAQLNQSARRNSNNNDAINTVAKPGMTRQAIVPNQNANDMEEGVELEITEEGQQNNKNTEGTNKTTKMDPNVLGDTAGHV